MTAEDLEASDGGRVVVPELTATQQQQLPAGALSLDSLIRAFVRERLAYRFLVTSDGVEAGKLERAVRRGCSRPVSPI
jgi:hypothetical protein